jgi:hypothetical protein
MSAPAGAPSRARRRFFSGKPPPYPTNFPLAPITRWHGTTIGMGFAPFAAPTPPTAVGAPLAAAPCEELPI